MYNKHTHTHNRDRKVDTGKRYSIFNWQQQ